MEVVKTLKMLLGTISLDFHYKSEYGFGNYFLSRTLKTNNDTQFIRFWEKVFNCRVSVENMNIINGSGLLPCTADEKTEEENGYYPLTPLYTVVDAVYSFTYALKVLIEILCHKEQKWMVNSAMCVINPNNPKMYSHMIFSNLLALSYPDGTIKSFRPFTNNCQYDIHLLVKKKENTKV